MPQQWLLFRIFHLLVLENAQARWCCARLHCATYIRCDSPGDCPAILEMSTIWFGDLSGLALTHWRKCEMASWVVPIGRVGLMSSTAYRPPFCESLLSVVPEDDARNCSVNYSVSDSIIMNWSAYPADNIGTCGVPVRRHQPRHTVEISPNASSARLNINSSRVQYAGKPLEESICQRQRSSRAYI